MDPSQMMPRSFPMWLPPPPTSDAMPPPQLPFLPPPNANLAPNRGWKRKNPNQNPSAYQPPAIGDLQVQNRAKARRWFKPNPNNNPNRRPFFHKPKAAAAAKAPRNTTSFIIRAKRAGGIPAPTVSPCPVTPAVLPTPVISPAGDEGLLSDVLAQRQWGVDGYGSMKGLIRLRPHIPDEEEDEENSSGGSDVEEHVEVERRLDHDLSRFEMVYPQPGINVFDQEDDEYDYDRAGQDDDVDVHVARLEEENLTLKERLFLMEQEVGDMRRRLQAIEARFSDGAGVASAENAAAVDGTKMAAAAGAADDDPVEPALKNAANAAAVADNHAVEEALKNDTVMEADADKTFGDSTEKGDAFSGADNAVDKSLENGNVEPEKSGEEERCSAGSENNAEIGGAASAQDNGEDNRQA